MIQKYLWLKDLDTKYRALKFAKNAIIWVYRTTRVSKFVVENVFNNSHIEYNNEWDNNNNINDNEILKEFFFHHKNISLDVSCLDSYAKAKFFGLYMARRLKRPKKSILLRIYNMQT